MPIGENATPNQPTSGISRRKGSAITGRVESPQAEYSRWQYRRVPERQARVKANFKNWREKNREKHLQYMREYYQKNKARLNKNRTEARREKRKNDK